MTQAPDSLRIIFAGTPDFAAAHLQALLDSTHQVIAVYSQPDRPAGRGKKLKASPVKELALTHDIPIYQPLNFKLEPDQQQLAELNADLMVVVAYGLLLPKVILATPKHGCINVHGSLLPRWRGAAPIQRAIAAGDNKTGVTIMQMDIGLDTGAMLLKTECDITESTTTASLHDELIEIGTPALLRTLAQVATGTLKPEQQDDTLSNYAAKISKHEALIDWSQAATDLHRSIRAFNPFPVCYSTLGGQRLKVWAANMTSQKSNGKPGSISVIDSTGITVNCGTGQLALTILQLPGKKAMPVADILRGSSDKFPLNSVLGAEV